MIALAFLIGIGVGATLAVLVLVITLQHRPAIERSMRRTEAKLKPKGKILEPESDTLTEWLKELPDEHA